MKNIGVLFGGYSPEYPVSLQSAAAVLRNWDHTRYHPVLIGISAQGDWFLYTGSVQEIADDLWNTPQHCTPVTISVSRSAPGLICQGQRITLDGVLPILHGRNGEDGTVQGLFSLAGIPVIGCGVLASALAMDKVRAHKLVSAAGVAVPKNYVLESPNAPIDRHGLTYPLFVKPVKAGSSFGITMVEHPEQLPAAVAAAFQYDDAVLLEERIPGFEVGCAVCGTEVLTVGCVDKISLSQGFFDFTEKYTLKTSEILLPAPLSPEKTAEIQATAKKIYRALGCSGFARVDMFLTEDGKLVFNEVNTIPGFTEHSRFPNMLKAAGISFSQVLSGILREGLHEMS